MLKLPRQTASLLFACGAGAAIAASFHAPLAGTLFALEIVLGDFGAQRLAPIVLSCVTATVTSTALLGGGAELQPVGSPLAHPFEIGLHLALGAIAGGLAIVYAWANHSAEELFAGHRGGALGRWLASRPIEVRLGLGGLCVGLVGLLAPRALGTGIESMNAALAGQIALTALLGALLAKLVMTGLTLGSGAPGGSFFPAVFLGAMLGAAFGQAVHFLLPGHTAGPESYAAVGMGAVVAGATVAPLTGVLMIFELTGSYQLVLPLLVACGFAAVIVQAALGGSIYSLKAQERGVTRGGPSPLRELSVATAVDRVEPIPEDLPWRELVRRVADTAHAAFPVISRDGQLVGVLSVHEVRAALLDPSLEAVAVARDLARAAPALQLDDSLEDGLRALDRAGVAEAAVLEAGAEGAAPRPVGVLTREALLHAWKQATDARTPAGEG
jgi:CIC family chloride channel protein